MEIKEIPNCTQRRVSEHDMYTLRSNYHADPRMGLHPGKYYANCLGVIDDQLARLGYEPEAFSYMIENYAARMFEDIIAEHMLKGILLSNGGDNDVIWHDKINWVKDGNKFTYGNITIINEYMDYTLIHKVELYKDVSLVEHYHARHAEDVLHFAALLIKESEG